MAMNSMEPIDVLWFLVLKKKTESVVIQNTKTEMLSSSRVSVVMKRNGVDTDGS